MNKILPAKTNPKQIPDNKGSALIIAIFLTVIVAALSLVCSKLIQTSFNEAKQQQHISAEADNIAKAGLVDALSWFRRQVKQPVCSGVPPTKYAWADGAFDPKYDTDLSKRDTIDANIGIVKEYQLNDAGTLWGRYEVKRQTNTTVAAYDKFAVHDITQERVLTGAQNGSGLVWSISSAGYIYQKNNPSKKFNESPNRVVARSRISTEIRKISIDLPLGCAYIVNDCGKKNDRTVKIANNGRISGGAGYGVGYYTYFNNAVGHKVDASNFPYETSGSGSVTGSPDNWINISTSPVVEYVLGVTKSELKNMADYVIDNVSSLPAVMPDMNLVYIQGDATFTNARPLNGSGILFIDGDLTISANSNSLYSGLIYVTGSAVVYEPCSIYGCMIAFNGLILSESSAADIAEITYDPNIIAMVRQKVCQYRENRSFNRVYTGIANY